MPFDTYNPKVERLNLDKNPQFTQIWHTAYNLLNENGAIILGSVYIDSNNTRIKQEAFYRNYGMTVITDEFDSFSATKQRFWSQRFTKQKLYDYLNFVKPSQIVFTGLDDEEYSMQVCICK